MELNSNLQLHSVVGCGAQSVAAASHYKFNWRSVAELSSCLKSKSIRGAPAKISTRFEVKSIFDEGGAGGIEPFF